jgi:hypothetical protein
VLSDQEHQEQTVKMLNRLRGTWKKTLLGLPLLGIVGFFYFYGIDMIAYPWAHKLTPTTPQGNWIGTLTLNERQSFLVNIKMAHDTVFSNTQSNTVPDISGEIFICQLRGNVITSRVWGNPNWIGTSVVLGTKIDFGSDIVPEKIACKAKSGALDCLFDFERPISRASKKFREEFKKVYTPKAEFNAKLPVSFAPLKKGDVSFADQCK